MALVLHPVPVPRTYARERNGHSVNASAHREIDPPRPPRASHLKSLQSTITLGGGGGGDGGGGGGGGGDDDGNGSEKR